MCQCTRRASPSKTLQQMETIRGPCRCRLRVGPPQSQKPSALQPVAAGAGVALPTRSAGRRDCRRVGFGVRRRGIVHAVGVARAATVAVGNTLDSLVCGTKQRHRQRLPTPCTSRTNCEQQYILMVRPTAAASDNPANERTPPRGSLQYRWSPGNAPADNVPVAMNVSLMSGRRTSAAAAAAPVQRTARPPSSPHHPMQAPHA